MVSGRSAVKLAAPVFSETSLNYRYLHLPTLTSTQEFLYKPFSVFVYYSYS
jgi:hypothetical protein